MRLVIVRPLVKKMEKEKNRKRCDWHNYIKMKKKNNIISRIFTRRVEIGKIIMIIIIIFKN